jgi:hypothetical protein
VENRDSQDDDSRVVQIRPVQHGSAWFRVDMLRHPSPPHMGESSLNHFDGGRRGSWNPAMERKPT